MSDLVKTKLESELLKKVAYLVETGEIRRAIALLKEVKTALPNSSKILSVLGKLYLQVGENNTANQYIQASFNISSPPTKQADFELPSEDDFDFLTEQSTKLQESEYSFDNHSQKKQVPRKVLSLKRNKVESDKNKSDASNAGTSEQVKILIKDKYTHHLRDSTKPVEVDSSEELSSSHHKNIIVSAVLAECDNETINDADDGSSKDQADIIKSRKTHHSENNENGKEKADQHIKGEKNDESSDFANSSYVAQVETIPSPENIELDINLTELAHPTQLTNEEAVLTVTDDVFDELTVYSADELNDEIGVNLDCEADDYQPEVLDSLDGFSDFDDGVDSSSDNSALDRDESELFDFWDNDTFEDQDEEAVDTPALDNTLTLEDRARLIAVECILAFGWDTKQLPFLIEVLARRGWSNTKRALEREVQAGATFDELALAYEIKELWQESSRYWINFNFAFCAGESTDATYRHCSWSQALRLVRMFTALPTIDEIYDFFEHEFECWYANHVFRKCFPAFNKYLFNYRLNERNVHSFSNGFAKSDAYDGMDGNWSYHTHTDEMVFLRESGVDLLTQFAPKNYYSSDKYTSEYLLEYYRSFGDE